MKKTKIIISISGLLVISLTALYVYNNNSKQQDDASAVLQDNGLKDHMFGKEMYLDSKMDEFHNLSDVENTTDELVIAEKISQDEPTIVYGQEGRIDIAYTLSTFKVKKSIEGNVLKENDTFTMLENEAYDKKQDVTYHIGGYNLIQPNKEYLLFLRQSETDPYYIVAGVNYGKVDLEDKQTDFPVGLKSANTPYSKEIIAEYANQEKIRDEAKEKYKDYLD